ncbi:hypothetical protein G3I44_16100 [Halogeometricum borinquense]|uniref:Uncharacterized protein n=1 Tax=Halogeometricum borinquense TaxID=60847 RepID=A0A6C0UMT0_9EURY|nr:hypothetical protein G3I44_16100 [Halogeometricum borinquense]
MGFGVGFVGVSLAEILLRMSGRIPTGIPFWASVTTSAPFALFLIIGGYWLKRSDVSEVRYPRVLAITMTVLLRAAGENPSMEPTNLSRTLRDELTSLQNRHPEVDIDRDIPDEVYVAADLMLKRLANRYDGRIELTETGPDGSVFTVELPLATP